MCEKSEEGGKIGIMEDWSECERERGNDAASAQGEPWDELATDAALRESHVLIGEERKAAEGAAELVVEPTVDAAAVEHVAAGKHTKVVPALEGALAHHAVMVAVVWGGVVVVGVEELVVEGELIGEHDEAGEARSDGGEEVVVDDLVGVEPWETQWLEESEEHGAEVVDTCGDLCQHKQRNWTRRHVV